MPRAPARGAAARRPGSPGGAWPRRSRAGRGSSGRSPSKALRRRGASAPRRDGRRSSFHDHAGQRELAGALQLGAEPLEPALLEVPDRLLGLVEQLRDVGRAVSLDEPEEDDLAVPRLDLPQRAEDGLQVGRARRVALDVGAAPRLDRHVEQRRALVLAAAVDRGVARDPVEEGDEREALVAVAGKRFHRFEEHLAHQVLRLVRGAGPGEAVAVERLAVALVELAERSGIAGLGGPNEGSIRARPGSHPDRRRHSMLSHLCVCFGTLTGVHGYSLTLAGGRSGITQSWTPSRSSFWASSTPSWSPCSSSSGSSRGPSPVRGGSSG